MKWKTSGARCPCRTPLSVPSSARTLRKPAGLTPRQARRTPPPPHPKNAASPHNRCAPTRRCHACAAVDVPLYHERQHLSLCAVHALNNIFGNQPGAQASRAPLRGSTVGVRPERLRPPLTSPVTARRLHRGTGIGHWAPMPAVESPMLPAPCGSPPCLSRAAEPRRYRVQSSVCARGTRCGGARRGGHDVKRRAGPHRNDKEGGVRAGQMVQSAQELTGRRQLRRGGCGDWHAHRANLLAPLQTF